jgi:enamine deaminase RidA (YjgF/YER057c/UK114 family)
MATSRASNPSSVAQGKGLFSHVIEVDAASVTKTVFISGQVAWNSQGQVVGRGQFREQFVQVYENLRNLVASAGGGLEDVVQLRTYLTDRALLPTFFATRDELYPSLFPSGKYPTNTLLVVGGLADPELLLEVEAIAVL